MNIKKIIKSKKFKSIVITTTEILVVAGIIFGALMFIYGKVNKEADRAGRLSGKGIETETRVGKDNNVSNHYYIEINKKKNALIVYQYSKDKKTKKPYKIFRCSVGSEVRKGKYKTSNTYTWLDINGNWHKYNTQYGDNAWIQSANYRNKYDYTLDKASYKAIGEGRADGFCIFLTAQDAEWIFSNCKEKTEVVIIKGKKTDKLPLQFRERVKADKYCGWDPTDPDKNNPYQKISNEKIVSGVSTVYVERGHNPSYLANLLVREVDGKNVAGKVKYKEIDSSSIGSCKVRYTYQTKSGKKLKLTQKFSVIDTTPPVVTCSKTLYTYEVAGISKKDLNKKSNIEDIQKLVRSGVSCNESDVNIQVFVSALPEELKLGKFPVVVKAQDASGNVGATQTMVEIKIKKAEKVTKFKPPKDFENQQKKKAGIKVDEETKKTKNKKSKSKETVTKASKEASTVNE